MSDIKRRELLALLMLSTISLDFCSNVALASSGGGEGGGDDGGGGGDDGGSGGEGGNSGSGSGNSGSGSGSSGSGSSGSGGESGSESGSEAGSGQGSGSTGRKKGRAGGGRDDYDGLTNSRTNSASQAQSAIQSGQARPLSQIIPVVNSQYKGRVIGVDFRRRGKLYVYRIKVVRDSGRIIIVEVNAVNKRILSVRKY